MIVLVLITAISRDQTFHGTHRRNKPHGRHIKSRLVNSRYFKKKFKTPAHGILNEIKYSFQVPYRNPRASLVCLLPVFSFPRIPTRIPTLASLNKRYSKITETVQSDFVMVFLYRKTRSPPSYCCAVLLDPRIVMTYFALFLLNFKL